MDPSLSDGDSSTVGHVRTSGASTPTALRERDPSGPKLADQLTVHSESDIRIGVHSRIDHPMGPRWEEVRGQALPPLHEGMSVGGR